MAGRKPAAPNGRAIPVTPGAQIGQAETSDAAPAPVAPTPARYATALEDTALIPHVAGPGPTTTPVPPTTAGNVLIRPADATQVIPRLRPDVQPPWVADPAAEADEDAHTNEADAVDHAQSFHRRSGWVWAGLAIFWLLALGAGVVTLASLGAPHFLCTGSAAKGLACKSTGTVLAAILTVTLIVTVGAVSVLAIETRRAGRTAWRWLGIGVVALVVVGSCGYLLIRTIGG